MAEPVDALVSNTNIARCAGSTPAPGTRNYKRKALNTALAYAKAVFRAFLRSEIFAFTLIYGRICATKKDRFKPFIEKRRGSPHPFLVQVHAAAYHNAGTVVESTYQHGLFYSLVSFTIRFNRSRKSPTHSRKYPRPKIYRVGSF